MPEKDFNEWDMKLAEWRGYVVRALEDSNKELREIKENQRILEEKIDKVNGRLTNVQVKVAGLSATVTLIVSLVLNVIL